MILPTKHLSTEYSLIGIGAEILKHLERPKTVSYIWEAVKDVQGVGTYQRYILALDLLYACGIISNEDGLLCRTESTVA
jgi:hypothetical protein